MIIKISKKIKFYVPIEQEQLLKIMKYVIISLSVVALILGVFCGVLYFSTDRLTVEAGTNITAAHFTGNESSYFGKDFDPDCLKRPGTYYFTVITDGKQEEVCLKVVDTKAPVVTVKEIEWPHGAKTRAPMPEDFIDSVVEAGELTGEFIEALPEFSEKSSVYKAKIRFTDSAGNKTQIFEVTLKLVLDSEKPKIKVLVDTFEIKVGSISEESGSDLSVYRELVKVTDNCAGDIRLDIDDGDVDYSTPGEYTVKFTASDMIGNESDKVSITVKIVEELTEDTE